MSLIHKFETFLKDAFGISLPKEVSNETSFISKSSDELREVTGIVLVPEEVDLHGDLYSEEEIHKAMISFNTLCRKTKLQHAVGSDAQVIESWQAKSDDIIDGKLVKKGTWLMTMKLPEQEWKMVKDGLFTGFSIGCRAKGESIDGGK
jgi:hypothetical protein